MRALFDTNILVDYLAGRPEASEELGRYEDCLISRITWMEALVGGAGLADEEAIRWFLRLFQVVELTPPIAESAVVLRRKHKLRLPDAVILATAREMGCLLITRNTKDFLLCWPDIREPYRL